MMRLHAYNSVIPKQLHVSAGKAKFAQAIDTESGRFKIKLAALLRRLTAEHVHVPLEEFLEAAFLQ